MEILIASDLVPTEANLDIFESGDINTLLGLNLKKEWLSADFRIFNLEVPLSEQKNPISKCGPNLIAPTSSIKGIKALSPTLVTLANNHILDQGIAGLSTTCNLLEQENIPFVGVGNNIKESSKSYVIEKNGISVGIYACAENEFTIATDDSPGANPFDPLESLDHIVQLKSQCDYTIVLYHGGKEHYRYPSPYLQKVCRKMVQKGADLIVCQHSHCIGAYEKYENSNIVYGQGNFIFNQNDNEFWNTSLLVKLIITDELKVEYIPIVKTEKGVHSADQSTGKEILTSFQKRSEDILQEGFIENQYQAFAEEMLESYLRAFSGFGKWLSRFDRRLLRSRLLKRKYNKNQLLTIQNYLECEAHRELVLAGLKNGAK